MKKILLIISIITISGGVFAQESFGVKGGVNIASYHVEVEGNTATSDNLTGFNVGFFFENQTSDNFAVQIEAILSQQGGTEESSGFKVQEKLYYLNLPILLKFVANRNFGIYLGPQVGFLVGSNEVNGFQVKDFYNPIDVSGAFGFEAKFGGNIRLGGRYNLGLLNILEEDTFPGGEVNVTNRVIQFYVGVNL